MELLVIYDGECRFCRFGLQVVRRLDRRGSLSFCPFGHPIAEQILSAIPEEKRYESMHVSAGDVLLSATDAAREVLRELPLGRIAVAVGLHRTYPLIARYRWLLGRFSPERAALVTCGHGKERSLAAGS